MIECGYKINCESNNKMDEVTEVNALGKISSEVDESQIKFILSTQCIKAQALLADKLKKQIHSQKQTCGYISSANLKLQSEILEAEQKINSMLIAQETIKMANVELKKELLLTKEKKQEVIERIEIGENKYDALWLESKKRYESLPYVNVLLKTNEKADNLKNDINKLEEASLKLIEDIDSKTVTCLNIDKKRIIEMAEFIINEVPKTMKIIDEKTKLIKELTNKLKEYNNNKYLVKEKVQEKVEVEAKNEAESKNHYDDFIIPKLELPSLDFDSLSVKLDQVKLKNANANKNNDRTEVKSLPKRFEVNMFNKDNTYDLMSSYFTKPKYEVTDNENYSNRKLVNFMQDIQEHEYRHENVQDFSKNENYSNKKTINIIQDVKLDTNEVKCMMSKVNREALQPVDVIGVEKDGKIQNTPKQALERKGKEPIQSDEIEEIDLTTSRDEHIIFPPSPFLDITITSADNYQENLSDETEVADRKEASQTANSQTRVGIICDTTLQEGIIKRVSFDLPTQDITNDDINDLKDNDCQQNQLNMTASDDGYEKIKDMVLKKHNLDLSPQFVYAKNTKLQKKTEDTVVTSKFFDNCEKKDNDNDNNINETDKEPDEQAKDNVIENDAGEITLKNKKLMEVDVNEEIPTSSPKRQKLMEEPQSIKPVSGLLFSHGDKAIPDSLDVSISTTGFDGDNDFPHCLDASLLLSPKADIPMNVDNPEVLSQDVPNFLSGLRKAGFSFFGKHPSPDSKGDSNSPNPGTSSGFSFNFGGETNKNRGGLFSMFK